MVSAPALSSVSVMASVDLSVCCSSRGKMGLMSPMYAVNLYFHSSKLLKSPS